MAIILNSHSANYESLFQGLKSKSEVLIVVDNLLLFAFAGSYHSSFAGPYKTLLLRPYKSPLLGVGV